MRAGFKSDANILQMASKNMTGFDMRLDKALRHVPGKILFATGLLASAILVNPGISQAQSPIDQQLNQTRSGLDGLPEAPLAERILIGREDLVVLRPRQFFVLYANPSYTFTDNANFSKTNRVRDGIASMQAGIRFATQIAETVDVFAQAGYIGSRYRKSTALNFDGFQGKVGFSLPKLPGGLRLTASYEPSAIYAEGFGARKLVQHALHLSLARDFEIAPKLTLTPSLGLSYLPSQPSDYTSAVVRAGLTAVYLFQHNFALIASADLSYRSYNKYFPAVYAKNRRDTVFALNGGILWAPSQYVSLLVSTSYSNGRSTLDPFTYHATGITPTAQLSVRF